MGRIGSGVLLGVVLAIGGASAPADMLWDNFVVSPEHPHGYDSLHYLSSEMTATIPDSWAADDAVFAPACQNAIPTVSEWGIVVIMLMVLVVAKICFRRPCPGSSTRVHTNV